jgi:hypothetical protein
VNTIINVAKQNYTKPNILLNAPTIDCDVSDLDKPAKQLE